MLPEKHFSAALACERARADRTGEAFALLTFTSRQSEHDLSTLSQAAKGLETCLRGTDQYGMLDHARLGVIMPGTSDQGAWKVADKVYVQFPANAVPPLCRVYRYPAQSQEELFNTQHSEEWLIEETRSARAMETLFAEEMPAWKRALDIAGAGLGLLMLSPLFAVVALCIRLESRGPVLFKQLRTGCGGRPFHMFKFRSMVIDAEQRKAQYADLNKQDGPAFKIPDDPRVTRLGRILRKTSIDELPQLWNVLRGEMSLVGPRPLPCDEAALCEPWQRRRLDVTPGLTCIWQIQDQLKVTFDEWMRMDIHYIRNRTLKHDLKLVWKTLFSVVGRRNSP
jgi:lipopolysaccharide/colanic/teichoic acid biosynthesis glycosyltransferase